MKGNTKRMLDGLTMIGGSAIVATTIPVYGAPIGVGLAGYGLLSVGISILNRESKEAKKMNTLLEKAGYKTKDGVCAKVKKVVRHKSHDMYYIKIPVGLDVKPLVSMKYIFENAYQNNVEPLYDNQNYRLKVYTVKLKPGKEYPYRTVPIKDKNTLSIVVGMGLDGEVSINLSETLPHCLIGATSRAGKSRLVKSLLLNVCEEYSPKQVEIIYLDNKDGVEAKAFQNVKHVRVIGESKEDTILYVTTAFKKEMFRRLDLLKSKCVTTIVEYNELVEKKDRLPFQLIILDEMFPFITLQSNQKTAFYSELGSLLAMCSATGQHVIMTTQKPTADIIPTMITTNVGVRIGLRTANQQESINVINESGLEDIDFDLKGRGIIRTHKLIDFQSFWVTNDTINEICEKHKRDSSDSIPVSLTTIRRQIENEQIKSQEKEVPTVAQKTVKENKDNTKHGGERGRNYDKNQRKKRNKKARNDEEKQIKPQLKNIKGSVSK